MLSRTAQAFRPECDRDVQLMLRVRQNDPTAFGQLVDRYRTAVYNKLFAMLRQREDVEDLTQDVFLRVFTHRGTYRPQSRFAAWLFRIVLNVGRNALRTRRRTHRRLTSIWNESHARPDSRGSVPLEALLRCERRAQIDAVLGRMAHRQSAVLQLYYFEQCSHTEISQRLHLTRPAVDGLLRRGRQRLRNGLRIAVRNDGHGFGGAVPATAH